METFLGVVDGAVWDTLRHEFPNSIAELYKLGPNPFNFVNAMGRLLTGQDPNLGSTELQKKAATYLDQIVLYDWPSFDKFSSLYFHYARVSGNAFNREVLNMFFRKLPAPLGTQTTERWEIRTANQGANLSIGQAVLHCFDILQEHCRNIQVQKQLKKSSHSFCANIETPIFGERAIAKKKPSFRRNYRRTQPTQPSYKKKQTKTRYAIRKSNSKKPCLDPKKRVRRYNLDRPYKKNCRCFICGDEEHLANTCPKRRHISSRDKDSARACIINDTNVTLVGIDEDMLDNESIWSIQEYEVLESKHNSSSSDTSETDEEIEVTSKYQPNSSSDEEQIYDSMYKQYMGYL